jgi:hypothetical protein
MTESREAMDDAKSSVPLVIPLPDLFEFFPYPHQARIVSGLDILSRAECGLSPDAILTFRRQNNSLADKVTLSWHQEGTQRTIQLPVDSPLEFFLLPYDPRTDDCKETTCRSVADLSQCFPPFVRVKSVRSSHQSLVKSDDLLKLLRLGQTCDNDKYIECRPVNDTRLINLPFDCSGEFVAVFDTQLTYTLADLVCGHVMPVRRRRVLPASIDKQPVIIQNIPPDVSLFVEPPTHEAATVEARPLDDPTTLVRLPDMDVKILVSPVSDVVNRRQSLASLVEANNGTFPLAVRVADWKEETTVLENHFVRPGVELILHGTTRITKVSSHASYS